MIVAKINNNLKFNPLLTFYKLKVYVCNKNSYGGFHLKELKKISSFINVKENTLRKHINYLIANQLITKDSNNQKHLRVRRILQKGRNIAFKIQDNQLLSLTPKQFKALMFELISEIRIKHNAKQDKKLLGKKKNGNSKGCQLFTPISCSYQAYLNNIHRSTACRRRKENKDLYLNHKIVIPEPVMAKPYIRPYNGFIYIKNGVLYLNQISFRKDTNLKVAVRR